ncbi:AAA family ATPase [Floridanema aerugineum]|uniref:AAA family ATPase n=1 Tax=Floridaenema aerugineum BLCC-F46 TaxID=3153654 RepID=A0ABV4XC78_9CYAN
MNVSNHNFFYAETFEILEKLNHQPTLNFYQEHREKFIKYVEQPFEQLVNQVASELPPQITDQLNIQIGNFSYPQWRWYEHSFYCAYPESIDDTQLFIAINHCSLVFGLFIGSEPDKKKFIRNFRYLYRYNSEVKELITKDGLEQVCTICDSDKLSESDCTIESLPNDTFSNASKDINSIKSIVFIKKTQVLSLDNKDIVTKIRNEFERIFPLFLMGKFSNARQEIINYIQPREPVYQQLSLPFFELRLPLSYRDNLLVSNTNIKFYKKVSLKLAYTLTQFIDDTMLEREIVVSWLKAIERKKQLILYGSPGTGKTFIAEKLAQHLIGGSNGFSELVQFHPAYSYEDFIQGIRPQNKDGQLSYSMVPGRFLEFCKKAESREGICVLIIDEINRANLAQVFGELMYLLEYRDKEIPLAGGNTFRIPSNVRIIGTMNTADRSIALVDHALRRRFAFIEIRPNYDVLRNYHEKRNTGFAVDGLIQVLQKLNQAIADKNYELGISFFLTEKLAEDIEDIWKMEIEPYLEEYFFDKLEKVDEFRWDKIKQQVIP